MELNVVLLLFQSAEEWVAGLLPITDIHLPYLSIKCMQLCMSGMERIILCVCGGGGVAAYFT